MPNQNPFEPEALRQEHGLTDNPFDLSPVDDSRRKNPFEHENDSMADLEQAGTDNGGTSGGYGFGGYGQSAQPALTAAELAAKKREEDLDRREREIRERESAVGIYKNNWPPFFPFIHHDISTLPAEHQNTVKFIYFQWLALALTLIVNLLGCIFLHVAGSSEGGADTAAAGGYIPVIGIASFILWYRPIYLGFKKTEARTMAFFFYLYFLFAGFHLLFSIYMAIGIPSTGSAGLINTISMFSQGHILAGVFGAISSAGWVLQSAGGGLLYKRVRAGQSSG